MLDLVTGTVKQVKEKSITLMVNGMGLSIACPRVENFPLGQEATVNIYFHWNADRGPALYGFSDELEKTVFLMVIDCHKIGPSIGLQILSQINTVPLLEIIAGQNVKALSSLNGIGPKKAELLINELKGKAAKLLSSGTLGSAVSLGSTSHLPNVSEALSSLGYSKQEISQTLNYLAESYTDNSASFDQLIRAGLAYLSKTKSL